MMPQLTRIGLLLLGLLTSLPTWGQLGGASTYAFLNLPASSRLGVLGGSAVANPSGFGGLHLHNPALLSPSDDWQAQASFLDYLVDINVGGFSLAKDFEGLGTCFVGLNQVDYGVFQRTDEAGLAQGQFQAAETVVFLGASRQLDSAWRVGATLKPIYSSFEQYSSLGVALDLGAFYQPNANFSAGLLVRHLGFQLTRYVPGQRERLPFEVQIGISQRLAHAPFRVNLGLVSLQRFDLSYDKPDASTFDPFTGESLEQSRFRQFSDNLLRHAVFGVEFLPSENFFVELSYNHRRRQELSISSRPGMVGFSFGVGLRVSKFQISYGRSSLHMAGATNHFTLATRLSDFRKKSS